MRQARQQRSEVPIERKTPDQVAAEYDRLAADYERRWRGYLDASIGETLGRVPLGEPERILDVGCGTGLIFDRLAEALPDAGLFGIDLSAGMLRMARGKARGRAALARATAERLPFRSSSFDLVLTVSALHYWQEPTAGLREMHRVLRPGGRVAITGWCLDYLTTRAIVARLRLTGRPLGQVLGAAAQARLLEEAGFADVEVQRYRIGLIWGMMTATARRPQR
jgi:ubiquinone/menaquinone biosynthesis C-methylase UbiE